MPAFTFPYRSGHCPNLSAVPHHLTRRIIVIAVTTLALLFSTVEVASARQGDNYVALGDSYASGVGAGDYIASSGNCDRSPHAYSALWAASQALASYQSVACSGATIASVTSSQLSALSTATTIASVTVGGNDLGFSSIMTDCILKGSGTCISEVNAAETQARAVLPGRLDAFFAVVRSRAPLARVVVLDYPHFYDLAHWCLGIAESSRTKIDEGIDVLDGLLQAATSRANFTFAEVRSTFDGHEICDSNRWLHSLNLTDLTESYHPTATGQSSGYLPAMQSAAS